MIKLSCIIPVLNSHEIVRRQLLHFARIGLGDMPDVELILMDDGSDPPLDFPRSPFSAGALLPNLRIVPTNDTRPWTWAIARNAGARLAKGDYYLMTDIDYIIPREALDAARAFTGEKMRFKREFGILDDQGVFTQDIETLKKYGLSPARIARKGLAMPPHPNNFVMRKDLYWRIGGYREDLVTKPYPQGEDRWFKRDWMRLVEKGKAHDSEERPFLYMFPNGQFCVSQDGAGDVDYNPFNLFHNLSRKTDQNPFLARTGQGKHNGDSNYTVRRETSTRRNSTTEQQHRHAHSTQGPGDSQSGTDAHGGHTVERCTDQRDPVRQGQEIAPSLSVLIPARNEEFLGRTIGDILEKSEGDTNIIAVLDGYWPNPSLPDHPRVHLIHHTVSVGQRTATNEAATISRAKYVMKLDAHSTVEQGFDVKLMAPYEDGRLSADVTTIPRMYNLHAFSWRCTACRFETYQGPMPDACGQWKCTGCGGIYRGKTPPMCDKCQRQDLWSHSGGCGDENPKERVIVWKPRADRRTDFARFDHEMHFQYWRHYEKHRKEAAGDFAEVLSSVGACFFMRRDRFWDLDGLDEDHGSWGQFGTEISCKSWLSGGRQVVNKTTWFSHLFRTQPGFSFPYQQSGNAQERAKVYSRDVWLNNKWPKQVRPLSWLIEKFWPVPGWSEPVGADALAHIKAAGEVFPRRMRDGVPQETMRAT